MLVARSQSRRICQNMCGDRRSSIFAGANPFFNSCARTPEYAHTYAVKQAVRRRFRGLIN